MSIIRSLNTVYTAIVVCHASYVGCRLARSGPEVLTSFDKEIYVFRTDLADLADSQHN